MLQRSLDLSRDLGYREGAAWSLNLLGTVAGRRGEHARARTLLLESLALHRELGDRWRIASVLEELAGVSAAAGRHLTAARQLAAAAVVRDAVGTPPPAVERPALECTRQAVQTALGAGGLVGTAAAVRGLPLDQLVATAGDDRAEGDVAAPAPAPGAEPQPVPVRAQLQVTALGTAAVTVDGGTLEPSDWGFAKPRELLYYLLDHPERTKEQVGADLWPWASPAQLRNSFHASLHALRRALRRSDCVVYRGSRYAFDRGPALRYDVHEFECALAAAAAVEPGPASVDALDAAVQAYGGPYLPDLDGEAWIEVRRAQLRGRYECALLDLGAAQLALGRPADAIRTYERAIAHDRLLETAHRQLVRCYARTGERGRALRHCRSLAALLKEELGVPVGPETAELAARLRRGEPV